MIQTNVLSLAFLAHPQTTAEEQLNQMRQELV